MRTVIHFAVVMVLLAVAAGSKTARGEHEMKYGVGDWPDKYGNHRVVVEVESSKAGAGACAVAASGS